MCTSNNVSKKLFSFLFFFSKIPFNIENIEQTKLPCSKMKILKDSWEYESTIKKRCMIIPTITISSPISTMQQKQQGERTLSAKTQIYEQENPFHHFQNISSSHAMVNSSMTDSFEKNSLDWPYSLTINTTRPTLQ